MHRERVELADHREHAATLRAVGQHLGELAQKEERLVCPAELPQRESKQQRSSGRIKGVSVGSDANTHDERMTARDDTGMVSLPLLEQGAHALHGDAERVHDPNEANKGAHNAHNDNGGRVVIRPQASLRARVDEIGVRIPQAQNVALGSAGGHVAFDQWRQATIAGGDCIVCPLQVRTNQASREQHDSDGCSADEQDKLADVRAE